MSLSQITALLRETLGLDVASVGVSLIERAVKRRVNAHGLRDVSQYADLLQRSPPELQNLFEAVVIPETFFFRYPEFRKQYFHKLLWQNKSVGCLNDQLLFEMLDESLT
jgi:chemotaxis methyl-accepting protein methylase